MFVPITFVDFTAGYDTNSAVLFPETVAVREVPDVHLGRASSATARPPASAGSPTAAAETLRPASCPPDAARLVDDQALAQETFVLWDLIHDRTHSHGDLPFDPFMIKQRMPFWMYALEELRCDLTAFREAVRAGGRRACRTPGCVQYAIAVRPAVPLPDHRRPGAQLRRPRRPAAVRLPAQARRPALDRQPADASTGSALPRRRDRPAATRSRRSTATASTGPRSAHWFAAYELVSRYVAPHPGSTWAKGADGAAAGRAAARSSSTRCCRTSSR